MFQVKQIGKYGAGIKNMISKRYAHASAYAREKVFVFGGFAHNDTPEEPPQTMSSAEMLSMNNNYWENVSPMNTARAFASVVSIQNQYCYLFGGLSDYKILNTIEKYDIVTDIWISLYFKLPFPLAK